MNVFPCPVWSQVTFQLYILPFYTCFALATMVSFYLSNTSTSFPFQQGLCTFCSFCLAPFSPGIYPWLAQSHCPCLCSGVTSPRSLNTIPETVSSLQPSLPSSLICFLHSSHHTLEIFFVSLFRLCLCL